MCCDGRAAHAEPLTGRTDGDLTGAQHTELLQACRHEGPEDARVVVPSLEPHPAERLVALSSQAPVRPGGDRRGLPGAGRAADDDERKAGVRVEAVADPATVDVVTR